MFVGIDLGTSGIKAVLVDDAQTIVGQATAPLTVSAPNPLWSEQDPEHWWQATNAAMRQLKAEHGAAMDRVAAVGLSGQMHGATLLDAADQVLRPCILWNDGRSGAECETLEERAPRLQEITGNLAMPGFTAPKLVWVAKHEPEVFANVAHVLLPKDYLRLRMTGSRFSEMSDASGTLWLDVGQRRWSPEMLAATELSEAAMPEVVEGSAPAGTIRADVAADWGLGKNVVVAGGAGDQAAGAIGVGTVVAGRAFVSLGTSGVYFAAGDAFQPNPERAVHAFCHALPGLWHQMSVILSAASCVSWVAALTGARSEAALLDEVATAGERIAGLPLFLPYLTGERTPLNDPHAKGVFCGLTAQTDRAAVGRAVLEGVAFALADCQDALREAGAAPAHISVIGGGARSPLWGRILAAALGHRLAYHAGGDVGPAFGAARLARLAATDEDPQTVCTMPPVETEVSPDPALAEVLRDRYAIWQTLYPALRASFPRMG